MKIGKTIFLTAATALLAVSPVSEKLNAQSKAETKLYNTVMAKRDLKNANKFLKKYPSSQCAPAVLKVKDSIAFYGLDKNDATAYITFVTDNPKSFYASAANSRVAELNTSSITAEQALEAAVAAGLQKETIVAATGVKNRNHIDNILESAKLLDALYASAEKKEEIIPSPEVKETNEIKEVKEEIYELGLTFKSLD